MPAESTLERVEKEIANGRLWRAKEILRSSIANVGYSKPILHRLADVLLSMNDDMEAGKYFLLAVDEPNARQLAAMELFLTRYARQGFRGVLKQFPPKTRQRLLSEYPTFLSQRLRDLGAPEEFDVALDFLLKFLLIVIGIMAVVHEFLPNELILLFYLF